MYIFKTDGYVSYWHTYTQVSMSVAASTVWLQFDANSRAVIHIILGSSCIACIFLKPRQQTYVAFNLNAIKIAIFWECSK